MTSEISDSLLGTVHRQQGLKTETAGTVGVIQKG